MEAGGGEVREGARSRVLQGGFGAFEDVAGGVARFAFRGLEELFGGFAFPRGIGPACCISRRCARRLASRRSRDCYVEAERSWLERISAGEALRVDSLGERGDGPCLV